MLCPVAFAGCQKTSKDASIVLSRGQASSPKVENGLAYDKATLRMDHFKTVVVPEDGKVEQGRLADRVEIFMEKSQHFYGHPPDNTSIRTERKEMGCVKKIEKDKIVLATYREWDSGIEGGVSIKVFIRVPDGVRVERRANLSGPIRAKRLPNSPPNRPRIEPGKDGWEAISDEPDPEQTAKSGSKRGST